MGCRGTFYGVQDNRLVSTVRDFHQRFGLEYGTKEKRRTWNFSGKAQAGGQVGLMGYSILDI